MKEITVEDLMNLDKMIPVDIRSPLEFNDFNIPGSVNVPLFSDNERVEIGTLYRKKGADAAKWRAMEVVSPKIPSILTEVTALSKNGYQPFIYCWRGGMRSKAVTTFLEYAGTPFPRLIGGYRAYRQYILDEIPQLIPPKAIVLHGMTGVGKTRILNRLEKYGYPVLDLERIANHRGSIFGHIGLGNANNQKTFDASLFQSLLNKKHAPFTFMEAESKRIGRVVQPDKLLELKQNGLHIDVHASLETRVMRIYEEYVIPYEKEAWFADKVAEGISLIIKRIKGKEIICLIETAINEHNYYTLISLLLEHYYDPRYTFTLKQYEGDFYPIYADDLDAAIDHLKQLMIEENLQV
ncbi:tRNA 2-selenouridine(34) synthase MnmH [Cytobacillus purgationiresistens]|uniref:tRNA 2-selenouridine synthase n=1 Tax=Cytobacillus purgationiresistens TaxID=863449 RepID=A0ABU0AJW2_9BACI|nr:tRNA 2-selenouridine(34) synthase MnmH [Cytobacillus purgationiresistens]MDQ0271553.1 tRNA 2-selenouridine synthase [Cytobacillus purgationiresistens]